MKSIIYIVSFVMTISIAIGQESVEFPEIEPIHPISGESYDYILGGKEKLVKRRNPEKTFIRKYVTLYNVRSNESIIDGIPWVQEDCHDESDRFAVWAISRTITRAVDSSLSFEVLGLELSFGGEVSKEISLSFERWIQASANIQAIHRPKLAYKEWIGKTYEVRYYPYDERIEWEEEAKSDFFMDLVDPIFFVEREIIDECEAI